MKIRIIPLAMVCLIALFTGLASRGDPGQAPIFLTGSDQKAEETVSKVDLIVIGTIKKLGLPSLKAAGVIDYRSTEVTVIKVLFGTSNPTIMVHLWLKTQGAFTEAEPTLGKQYIFFIKNRKNEEPVVRKLLEATDDNIAKVKALIAAAPAGK